MPDHVGKKRGIEKEIVGLKRGPNGKKLVEASSKELV
jgi:hypothetical protein